MRFRISFLYWSPADWPPTPTPVKLRIGLWPTGVFPHSAVRNTAARTSMCRLCADVFSRLLSTHPGADWMRRVVTLRSTAAAGSPRPRVGLPASPRRQLAALSPGHPGGCEAAVFELHLSMCLSAVGPFPLEKSPLSPPRRRAGLETGTAEKAGGGRAAAGGRRRGRSRGRFRECWAVACCIRRFHFWVWAPADCVLPPLLPGTASANPAQSGLASLRGPGAWAPLSR